MKGQLAKDKLSSRLKSLQLSVQNDWQTTPGGSHTGMNNDHHNLLSRC